MTTPLLIIGGIILLVVFVFWPRFEKPNETKTETQQGQQDDSPAINFSEERTPKPDPLHGKTINEIRTLQEINGLIIRNSARRFNKEDSIDGEWEEN